MVTSASMGNPKGKPKMSVDERDRVRGAVRDYLKERGISLTAFAGKIGQAQPSVQRWFTDSGFPSIQTANAVADVVGLPRYFWETTQNYPEHVREAVDQLGRDYPQTGMMLRTRLADAIAHAGNVTRSDLLASLAGEVIRVRVIGEDAAIAHRERNGAADNERPKTRPLSRLRVGPRKPSGSSNHAVDVAKGSGKHGR
jgi:transcriptional regulator with XRE-family HTH domain